MTAPATPPPRDAGAPSGYLPPGVPPPLLDEPDDATPAPFDPLRLCIFATIALLGWIGGPVTLLGFAVLGLVGYTRAWRAGLTRSRCFLRDIRLVLAYLSALAVAGLAGIVIAVLRVT
ncbi:MAG: hypothetical protein U0Q19_02720 [Kineosporiaceae bacterium]